MKTNLIFLLMITLLASCSLAKKQIDKNMLLGTWDGAREGETIDHATAYVYGYSWTFTEDSICSAIALMECYNVQYRLTDSILRIGGGTGGADILEITDSTMKLAIFFGLEGRNDDQFGKRGFVYDFKKNPTPIPRRVVPEPTPPDEH